MAALSGFVDEYRALYRKLNLANVVAEFPDELNRSDFNGRLQRGVPILTTQWSLKKSIRIYGMQLLSLIKDYLPDRPEALNRLSQWLESDEDNCEQLATLFLQRQGNDIVAFGREIDIDIDIVTFFLILLVRPLVEHFALKVQGEASLSEWDRGNCPVCGHWAAMGHINEEGHRTLWCRQCNSIWPYSRLQCVFCEQNNQEKLQILQAEEHEDLRVQACTECMRYLKDICTVESPDMVDFDKAYLATAIMDLAAKQRGFIQESVLLVRPSVRQREERKPPEEEMFP